MNCNQPDVSTALVMAEIKSSSRTMVTRLICYATDNFKARCNQWAQFSALHQETIPPAVVLPPQTFLCKPSAMCLYGLETIVMLFYSHLIFQGCNSHLIAFDIPQVPGQQIPIIHYFCHLPANILRVERGTQLPCRMSMWASQQNKENTALQDWRMWYITQIVSQSQTFEYSHKVWSIRSTLQLIMAGHLQKDFLTLCVKRPTTVDFYPLVIWWR